MVGLSMYMHQADDSAGEEEDEEASGSEEEGGSDTEGGAERRDAGGESSFVASLLQRASLQEPDAGADGVGVFASEEGL
jgi:hypothetical protein